MFRCVGLRHGRRVLVGCAAFYVEFGSGLFSQVAAGRRVVGCVEVCTFSYV